MRAQSPLRGVWQGSRVDAYPWVRCSSFSDCVEGLMWAYATLSEEKKIVVQRGPSPGRQDLGCKSGKMSGDVLAHRKVEPIALQPSDGAREPLLHDRDSIAPAPVAQRVAHD